MSLESNPLYAEVVAEQKGLEVPSFLNQPWFEGPYLFFCLFVLFQSFSNLGAGSPTIYLEGVAELGTVLESGKGKERASEVSSCQPKTRGSKKW